MKRSDPNTDEFLPTRSSLLSRLRNWEDRESWKEFFELYWRLIYKVCVRSGLNASDAQDVVQETVLSVAKQMPGFKYNPNKGSFKAWLMLVIRRRIADHFRKRPPWQGQKQPSDEDEDPVNELAAPEAIPGESLWDEEWNQNLMAVALGRVKNKVQPKHFQVFDLSVLKEWPVKDIVQTLHVNRAQVYVLKHRVSNLIKREIERLEASMGGRG